MPSKGKSASGSFAEVFTADSAKRAKPGSPDESGAHETDASDDALTQPAEGGTSGPRAGAELSGVNLPEVPPKHVGDHNNEDDPQEEMTLNRKAPATSIAPGSGRDTAALSPKPADLVQGKRAGNPTGQATKKSQHIDLWQTAVLPRETVPAGGNPSDGPQALLSMRAGGSIQLPLQADPGGLSIAGKKSALQDANAFSLSGLPVQADHEGGSKSNQQASENSKEIIIEASRDQGGALNVPVARAQPKGATQVQTTTAKTLEAPLVTRGSNGTSDDRALATSQPGVLLEAKQSVEATPRLAQHPLTIQPQQLSQMQSLPAQTAAVSTAPNADLDALEAASPENKTLASQEPRQQPQHANPAVAQAPVSEAPRLSTRRGETRFARETVVELQTRQSAQTQYTITQQNPTRGASPNPLIANWQAPSVLANESDRRATRELALVDPITGGTRLSQSGAPSTSATHAARAELPSHIARQLADVVQQMPNRPVEIALKPQELGSVRLMVQQAEAGIVVNVTAERPETLDLMRRHIDQLGQDFQALGYTNIAFSFTGSDAETHRESNSDDPAVSTRSDTEASEDQPATATQIHLNSGTSNGVDLRL